jgi:hypothetical protein
MNNQSKKESRATKIIQCMQCFSDPDIMIEINHLKIFCLLLTGYVYGTWIYIHIFTIAVKLHMLQHYCIRRVLLDCSIRIAIQFK